jgi:hypothetical protein
MGITNVHCLKDISNSQIYYRFERGKQKWWGLFYCNGAVVVSGLLVFVKTLFGNGELVESSLLACWRATNYLTTQNHSNPRRLPA